MQGRGKLRWDLRCERGGGASQSGKILQAARKKSKGTLLYVMRANGNHHEKAWHGKISKGGRHFNLRGELTPIGHRMRACTEQRADGGRRGRSRGRSDDHNPTVAGSVG